MKLIRPSLLLLAPLALAACDSSQPSYSASNPAPPPADTASAPAQPAAQPAPAPAPAAPAATAAAPASAQTGLPVRGERGARPPVAQGISLPPAPQTGIGGCDAYVTRYRACLTSDQGIVAPVQRKYQLAHALTRQVRRWQVDIKAGKSSEVAKACSAADNEARETLGKLGCKTI